MGFMDFLSRMKRVSNSEETKQFILDKMNKDKESFLREIQSAVHKELMSDGKMTQEEKNTPFGTIVQTCIEHMKNSSNDSVGNVSVEYAKNNLDGLREDVIQKLQSMQLGDHLFITLIRRSKDKCEMETMCTLADVHPDLALEYLSVIADSVGKVCSLIIEKRNTQLLPGNSSQAVH